VDRISGGVNIHCSGGAKKAVLLHLTTNFHIGDQSKTATPILSASDIIEYQMSQTPTSDIFAYPGIEGGYAQVLDPFELLSSIGCSQQDLVR